MSRLTFAGGFAAVAVGVLLARGSPATSYEASVYAGTPTATWVAFGFALLVAVCGALACRGREQAIAIGLGSTTVVSIVSLPLLRNYRFSGMGDALTHLGWTRDVVGGAIRPDDLFYPGVHSLAVAIHYVAGIPLERALLLVMVLLFVPFVVFVPLVVRDVSGNPTAVGIAAVLSWTVLPVNNVAAHMGVHSSSNAIFLAPVVIFALVAFLRRRATIERLPFDISPFSLLLYLTGIALLLVHPQQMVHVVLLVATVAVVQSLARSRYDDHPMLEHPSTTTHAYVLGGLLMIWMVGNETFRGAVGALVYGLFTADVGGSAQVDQQEGSLVELGGSLGELFVKLFLEAAVIGVLVALFVLVTWLGYTAVDRETKAFVTYFALSMIPLGGLFLVYFAGTPAMAFRLLGFVAVVVTILGGIAIAHLVGGLSRVLTVPGANVVAVAFLVACLVLGLMTVFSSPIIYDPGQHVTDEKLSGYESGLNDAAEDRAHVGLGYEPFRYDHAINGPEREGALSGASAASGEVDPDAFEDGDYGGAYHGNDYYLVVTSYDETREFEVYQELHYSEAALEGLERDPGANKVISNDEFRMYDVAGED